MKYFRERHGYEATDWLFLLKEDGEAANVFREDYYEAASFLFAENYVKKISRWCRENDLLFTGHFPEEDGISTQFLAGGDIMLNYVDIDYPGIDFLGRRLTSEVLKVPFRICRNRLRTAVTISRQTTICPAR